MKYLAIFLGCYGVALFVTSALINVRIEDIRYEVRVREERGANRAYLEEFIASARAAKLEYGFVAGTILGLIGSAFAWFRG